jgi:hypothetical protein
MFRRQDRYQVDHIIRRHSRDAGSPVQADLQQRHRGTGFSCLSLPTARMSVQRRSCLCDWVRGILHHNQQLSVAQQLLPQAFRHRVASCTVLSHGGVPVVPLLCLAQAPTRNNRPLTSISTSGMMEHETLAQPCQGVGFRFRFRFA